MFITSFVLQFLPKDSYLDTDIAKEKPKPDEASPKEDIKDSVVVSERGNLVSFTFLPVLPSQRSLSLFFVMITLSFTSGIVVWPIADYWIDKEDKHHLFLKSVWCNPSQVDSTDNTIKIEVFDKIFPNLKLLPSTSKRNTYYKAQHLLIADPIWREYILTEQLYVDYSQVFAFSFMVLLVISIFNFIIVGIRIIRKGIAKYKYKNKSGWTGRIAVSLTLICSIMGLLYIFGLLNHGSHLLVLLVPIMIFFIFYIIDLYPYQILTSILFLYFSVFGYLISSVAWKWAEDTVDKKTLGVFKSEYVNSSNKILMKIVIENKYGTTDCTVLNLEAFEKALQDAHKKPLQDIPNSK